MQNLMNDLMKLFQKDERIFADGKLLKNKLTELTLKLDQPLLDLLLSDNQIKEHFFIEKTAKKEKVLVFDKDKFIAFVNNKEFLPDSFTSFKNKIGLMTNGDYLKEKNDVVLAWAYKDCVLEGGQDKEDQKRDEIFYNETLSPDEIDRLFEPKVLTNFKKYDNKGEHKITEFNTNDNLIVTGNNLLALHCLKNKFRGEVKLIYIDPPFNTGKDTFLYNDRFTRSTWLTFMKNRLSMANELLGSDGNIFVHLDDNQFHYFKVLMDEIFGVENFVEVIIWAYGSPSGGRAAGAKLVGIHDYILHYAKNYSERQQFKIYTPYTDKYLQDWFKYKEKDGRIYQRRMRGRDGKGNVVWEKQYLDESPGVPGCTVWQDIKQIYADPRAFKAEQRQHSEMVDYDTQKPEKLLKRIIEYSTKEGDLILDFFNGSGTTTAVAHKMRRRWIGVEQLEQGVSAFVKRMKEVVKGDKNGVSKEVKWQGGGSFVYAELMEWNEQYMPEIKNADSSRKLLNIYEKMAKEAFFRYDVDLSKFEEKEFEKLPLKEQKQVLCECLDKNHLYVNLSEIDDATYKVSADEKKLNAEFYKPVA
jgi:adenine-specific DNA-methyltransferase